VPAIRKIFSHNPAFSCHYDGPWLNSVFHPDPFEFIGILPSARLRISLNLFEYMRLEPNLET